MKKLAFIKRDSEPHWVGDGFPVRNAFSYNDIAEEMSPFLLLDYAGPYRFPPTDQRRGVGSHPHRGFETVTVVYHGEVEHRDSSGGGGKIGPGDVQWMTAASGVVHEEFHGTDWAAHGGRFEVIQLWVNLPRKDKMTTPRYQALPASTIPTTEISGAPGSSLRVIAGIYGAGLYDADSNGPLMGPAHTFSRMNVWDVRLPQGVTAELPAEAGDTTALFVLEGKIRVPEGEIAGEAELALFERDGERIRFTALEDTRMLYLGGEPLHEPIVGYGPFVMSTEDEIRQAFIDYRSGRMGKLPT